MKKKERFGLMNETVTTKFAIIKIDKHRKVVFMTDVMPTGVNKGSVGWERGKPAHFFDDRKEAENIVCLMIPHNVFALVLEVPSYFKLEYFKN